MAAINEDFEKAPSPGVGGEIDTSGLSLSLSVEDLTEHQWVYVYDPKTGDRSLANKSMLKALLKHGFVTKKPLVEPFKGRFMCFLHKDGSFRAHYDAIGLPVCNKANIPSLYQLNLHMSRKHKMELATIETEKKELEDKKKEERDTILQEALLNSVRASGRPGGGGEVKETPPQAPAPAAAVISHRGKRGRKTKNG